MLEPSDTEIIMNAILDGFNAAASEGKSVQYIFGCETPTGKTAQVAITIEPYKEIERSDLQ